MTSALEFFGQNKTSQNWNQTFQCSRRRRWRWQEAAGPEGRTDPHEGRQVDDDQRQDADHHAEEELDQVVEQESSKADVTALEPVSLSWIKVSSSVTKFGEKMATLGIFLLIFVK